MEDSVDFNIVLLPDKITQKTVIDLSKEISSKYKTQFILNSVNPIPHVTLYQAKFPVKNIIRIKSAITKIAKGTGKISIKFSKFTILSDFLFWETGKHTELIRLHWKIITELNPLRKGLLITGLDNMKDIYPGAKYDIERYGSLLTGNNYLPHLTITAFKEKFDKREVLSSIKLEKETKFDKISLGLLGKFGTVEKIIFESTLI